MINCKHLNVAPQNVSQTKRPFSQRWNESSSSSKRRWTRCYSNFNGSICMVILIWWLNSLFNILIETHRFSKDIPSFGRGSLANVTYQFSDEVLSALLQFMRAKNWSASAVNRGHLWESSFVFLNRLPCEIGDIMHDKNEFNLPFFRAEHVYEVFSKEFKTLHPNSVVPTKSWFLSIWKGKVATSNCVVLAVSLSVVCASDFAISLQTLFKELFHVINQEPQTTSW